MGKLKELSLLGSLNILQFLLLGSSDVIPLAHSFLAEELIELASSLLGLLIVALDLALLSVLFQQPQEVENLIIG